MLDQQNYAQKMQWPIVNLMINFYGVGGVGINVTDGTSESSDHFKEVNLFALLNYYGFYFGKSITWMDVINFAT